jgi:hypothetical protein
VLTFFGGAFTGAEYQLYLRTPAKLAMERRGLIQKWEQWLSRHSQSSWYRYQVRLCDCILCPKNRPFQDLLHGILPELTEHKNFLPTPQKDDDEAHFLPLSDLLQRPYCRPDFHLPENFDSKMKPILCLHCDKVCTSQKDYWKHRQYEHQIKNNLEGDATTSTTSGQVEKSSKNSSKKSSGEELEKTPKTALKRSRGEEKSPTDSSPKKKVRFTKKSEEDDSESDVLHDDEEQMTPEELDFFSGSTTFGRQVQELGERKTRKTRRKSE